MRKPFFVTVLLLLLLLGWGAPVFCLDPAKTMDFCQHNVWTIDDGLPINSIFAITQTSDGYLWLGTEMGLARFDGVKFDVYDHENTPVLTNDLVLSLLETRDGVLWIGTRGGGIVRYKNRRFEPFNPEPGLLNNEIWFLLESGDGSVWIGTREGLNRYSGGTLTEVKLPGGEAGRYIKTMMEDRIGRLWVGTRGGGLVKVKKRGSGFIAESSALANTKINTLLQDQVGTIWAGTMEKGLVRLRGNQQTFYTTANGLSNNHITSLYQDGSGNLWIGTFSGGINVIRPGRENVSVFDTRNRLTSNTIYAFYEDREDTLWIGTEGGGLNSLRDTKITTYTKENGMSGNIVYGVFLDSRDRAWTGINGLGVDVLQNRRFSSLTVKDGLSSDSVVSFMEGQDGVMWFGTQGGGICRYHTGKKKMNVFTDRHGLSENFVRALYKDREGNIWAGTDNGGVHRFVDGKFQPEGTVGYRVNVFYRDRAGVLWIGTYGGGLFRMRDGKIDRYGKKHGLSGNIVMCIYEDKNRVLWLGTYGTGLNRFSGGRARHVGRKDGLPDNTVYWILDDHKGDLWMSSNRGIYVIGLGELENYFARKTARLSPRTFGRPDGMRSSECNGGSQPAASKGSDGRLWFPTTGGLSVIDPENIGINKLPPLVALETAIIGGNQYPPGQPAIVPPGSGNVEFRYTALSFVVPGKIRFRFKLDGFDKEWVEAGNERVARYSGLGPGEYTFRVTACNSDGVWNPEGKRFRFHLKPRFYQTVWFTIVLHLGFFALGALGYAIFIKTRNARKQKNKYRGAGLDGEETASTVEKILYLSEVEKIYRRADITLEALANELNVTPRNLSHIINDRLKKNFNELMNHYRIKEARKRLKDDAYSSQSILEIAYDVGFNSKSSFNRVFKQFTGITPSQYRKEKGIIS